MAKISRFQVFSEEMSSIRVSINPKFSGQVINRIKCHNSDKSSLRSLSICSNSMDNNIRRSNLISSGRVSNKTNKKFTSKIPG